MNLPTISIIIPTLNSAKTLGECLDNVILQDYPKDSIEIIIADGGSVDATKEIIKSKLVAVEHCVLDNPLKTGEAGKAIGVKHAKNEIIALIDSDNILPQYNWLRQIVEPFQDPEIIASEPLYYTYRIIDKYITRYCALLGMNDPLCFFLGNYDRYCILTNKWTEIIHTEEDKGSYLKIAFPNLKKVPTIGANGFCIRREALFKGEIGDYLFDIDILSDVLHCNKESIAKVKNGIIHIFSKSTRSLFRKQIRRIRDYNYYKSLGLRRYSWDKIDSLKVFRFMLHSILIFPLMFESTKGYLKKKDIAWFYHPIACWLTCFAYGIGMYKNMISARPFNRADWTQG